MARNLTRSSRGFEESSASSRTRRLNCIQEKSRPLKSFCFCTALAMCVPCECEGKSTAFGGSRASSESQAMDTGQRGARLLRGCENPVPGGRDGRRLTALNDGSNGSGENDGGSGS